LLKDHPSLFVLGNISRSTSVWKAKVKILSKKKVMDLQTLVKTRFGGLQIPICSSYLDILERMLLDISNTPVPIPPSTMNSSNETTTNPSPSSSSSSSSEVMEEEEEEDEKKKKKQNKKGDDKGSQSDENGDDDSSSSSSSSSSEEDEEEEEGKEDKKEVFVPPIPVQVFDPSLLATGDSLDENVSIEEDEARYCGRSGKGVMDGLWPPQRTYVIHSILALVNKYS